MDKVRRNCSNCTHSFGKKSFLECIRTGRYCETEMEYGGMCNNRQTGELRLWADKEVDERKEGSTSFFKKIIKLVKGE